MMKFPLLVLFATGALSAPFFDTSSFNAYFFEDDCTDPRIHDDATSIYQYEGETLNTVQGSTSESTGLKLKATVYIHPLGACKYRMQINNPELLEKGKNQKFQAAQESAKLVRELEAQDLLFKTSKGRINKLFPAAGEALHTLNIKRGILSTLQLQTDAKEEIDVNGKCKVHFTEKDGVIVKSKDLSECSDRALNEIGLQTANFAHDKTPIKPLKSKSSCHYVTKDKKIRSVQCDETHIFRPFSAGYSKPAGAMTTVKQVMKLLSLKGKRNFAVETKPATEPVTLIFGHEKESTKPDNSIVDRIDTVMAALVKQGSLSAKQSSAHEFVQLVNLIRKLDTKRMRPIMDKYFNFVSSDENLKSVYRQFMLDALTYCGTPTCVTTVHNVIMSGDVSGEYRNMFLQGISLVAKPTKQMIRDVLNIARNKPSRQAFLALGILIQRYCKINSANCAYSKTNPVTVAEHFLEGKLGEGCEGQDNHDRVEEILMTIKAIRNAAQPSRVTDVLLRCAKTAQHMNITTAALDAIRRMPCNDRIQSALHTIHEDINTDVEKRIQTYLTLVNCPSDATLKRIVAQLEGEKSKQVGSFLLSHLKNIIESSDPKHTETQKILSKLLEGKDFTKFDLPFTKFSKAFEGSVYSKYMKSGATVNGHLIYNPDSFVPKSSLVSMSANILDVPVEIFEMAARIDGVESIVEDFFGPYGYFPDETVVNFFNSKFKKEDIEKLRTRRNIDENYENTVKDMHKTVNKKKQPSGFFSMKVLGHEMRMFSFDDLQWAANEIDNMNVIELLLKVAKGGHKTFTKSIMFMEMTHTVPTGLGLPIKLKLTGSAVGTLELDGKFDIRNMFWGPMALEVKGSVKPSTVVEISGQMGVHSQYLDTGMFLNTSMFTSQVLKGSVVYREGQQLKINIDAPEKPIEFFNVSSTPFMYVNEDIKLIDGTPRRLSPDFCLNSKMVLGLGLCTRVSVPVAFRDYEAPYFPLSGPASFGLKLVKADPKLTTYQFLVSLTKRPLSSGRELIGTFEVGTPGATYSRGVAGSIKYLETTSIKEITIGTLKEKSNTELRITYHNNTNKFEVNFGTDVITSKPVNVRFMFFNETSYMSKETGIMASATYDWYKFQHVTKFVRKLSPTKSFLLHTRTTYWPGKYVTGEAEYTPGQSKVSLRFDANQFNQRIEMDGKILSTETGKGIDFTATHISSNKKISFFTGYTYTANTKKVTFNVKTMTSKPVEFVLGYYLIGKRHEMRFDASIFGKTGKLFVDYSNLRNGWHGMNVGGIFEENSVGVATSLNNEALMTKELCMVAYFNDKRPAKTCLSLKDQQLTWSAEVLKKTALVSVGLTTVVDKYTLNSVVTVQEKELLKNVIELTYKSMIDNELKMTTYAGQKSVMTRFFSTKENDDVTLFGVEGKGFGQFVKLQATYTTAKKGDASVYGVIFEGWVNKKLPMSYTVLVENAEKMKGIKTVLKIMDYTAKTGMFYGVPKESEYVFITDVSVQKKDLVMLGSKTTDVLVLLEGSKAYRSSWEITVWNKKFKYGFDMGYENRSTGTRSEYAMTFGVDFARNKRSAITATYAGTESLAELFIDFNYLPGRMVQHVFKYNKNSNKLDVSIEFLPKMFVKLTGQLNKIDGWKLNTDLTLSWSNYERTLQAVTAYINKETLKGLNFQMTGFNQKLFIGSEYNADTKTLTLSASAFGRKARLAIAFDKNLGFGKMTLSMQKVEGNALVMKTLLETLLRFSNKGFSYELKAGKTNILKLTGFLDKTRGLLELSVLEKSMGKLTGFYFTEEKRAVMKLMVLGTELFQMVGKYNEAQSAALLSFDFLKKGKNVVFVARWNKEKKEMTVAVEFMKKTVGITTRFDTTNYAAGMSLFYQKNTIGWSITYLKDTSSLVYKVTLSPKLTAKIILQLIADRVVALSFQRMNDVGFITELTMKYELSSTASSFIFEWNKGTLAKVKKMIVPAVTNIVKDITNLVKKTTSLGQAFSMKTLTSISTKALEIIDAADKKFDKIDFVEVRDKIGAMTVKAITTVAKLAQKSMKLSSKMLMKLHDNLPMMSEKAKVYFVKAVALSKSSFQEAVKLSKVTYEAIKSVTEAGVPVAKLAFKLAKEFKIRGKTTEEIVTNMVKMVEKLVKSYKENMSNQIKKMTEDVKNYINSVKIPFTDKMIVEVVKEYIAKLKSINIEEKAREITKMIMDYEVMGEKIKVYVEKIEKVLNNLPEEMKKVTLSIIKRGRMEMKKLKVLKASVEPLLRCMKTIYSSVMKHFGPLVKEAVKNIEKTLMTRVYTPIRKEAVRMIGIMERFFVPVFKPLKPMYEDIKSQIGAIKVLEKEIGEALYVYFMYVSPQIKENMNKLYAYFKTNIEMLKDVPLMTLEEIAEKIIDKTAMGTKWTITKAKETYAKRMTIYKAWKSMTIKRWEMVKEFWKLFTSKPVEDLFEMGLKNAEKFTMKVLKESSNVLNQISELDLATPIKQAWEDMDLLNHLERYGLNGKLTKLIAEMKKINAKDALIKKFIQGKKALMQTYKKLTELAMKAVEMTKDVAAYIKTIPKKDFETWYSEVETVALKTGKTLSEAVKDWYKMMTTFYNKVEVEMKKIYNTYEGPVKNAYILVKQRSMLVYDDVKDHCAITYDVYKTVIYGAATEQYKKLMTAIESQYKEMTDKMFAFYKKYEDKTWEEIGNILYSAGKKRYDAAYNVATKTYGEASKLAEKVMKKASEMKKTVEVYTKVNYAKIEKLFNEKIKPKAVELYKKVMAYINEKSTEMKASAMAAYEKLNTEVMRIYTENKYLSIRQLSVKVKKYVVEIVKAYIAKIKTTTKENYKKVYAKVMQLKNKFMEDVLPVLKEESVSIINQSLKATVIIIEETITAFKPHYLAARKHTDKYVKKMVATAKDYYSKAAVFAQKYAEQTREMTVKMYKEGVEYMQSKYSKLAVYLNDVMEKVKEHPKYQELIKTEAYVKIEKFIKWAKVMVNKGINNLKTKFEELKNHPKIAEMKMKITELKEHKLVKQTIKNLEQIRKSLMYSLEKIKGKLIATVKLYASEMEKIPELAMAKVQKFMEDPVTCFWDSVEQIRTYITMVTEYNWKELKTTAPEAVQKFYEAVTDDETKKAFNTIVTKGKEFYNKYYEYLTTLPSKLKTEAARIYKEQLAMLKLRYEKFIAQWKESALYPIFTNQVWSEIADEIMKHEITTELKNLAGVSLEKLQEIYKKMTTDMKAYMKEIKTKVMARYNTMMSKVNTWLDETTLEDVVTKIQDMYTKTMKEVVTKMQQLSTKVNAKYTEYSKKLIAFSKKQYGVAKKYFDAEYPKMVAKLKEMYAEYKEMIEKLYKKMVAKGIELKTQTVTKATEIWEKSWVKAKIENAKKMTVGETYAMLMKMPKDASKMYKDMSEMIVKQYNKFVQPYLKTAVESVKFVGTEINETLIFIVKYYELENNAKLLYTQGLKSFQNMLPKLPVYARQYLKVASKTSLKAIHSTLVFVDKIDFSQLKTIYEDVKKAIPSIKKYINVNMIESGVKLSIAHPYEVEPSFSYHFSNVKSKVETYANKVATKTISITKALLKELKARTMELRKDLNQSYLAHVELGKHIQTRLPAYKLAATKVHKSAKTALMEFYDFVKGVTIFYAKKGKARAMEVYDFGKMATLSVLQSQSLPEAYNLIKSHTQEAMKRTEKYFRPEIVSIKRTAKALYDTTMKKIKPYYTLAKESGLKSLYAEVEKDLVKVYEITKQMLVDVTRRTKNSLKSYFETEDLTALGQYTDVHTGIATKYAKQLYKLYKWNKVSLDHAIRRSKMSFLYRLINPIKRRINPLRTYAMIFGKRHVITFDGKYYEFPKYTQSRCAYLLARDFKDGKFTVYSKADEIITETADIKVSINTNGAVEGAIKKTKAGVTRTQRISGLPIETESAVCKRWSHYIKCEFKQGVTVRCNVKYNLCTVELAAWHFGKSQGILGTNNREVYDEFKMADNKLTTSLEQFANSWLVTKGGDCMMKESNNVAPTCNKAPSERCIELFRSKTSPLAKYFSHIDPLPFLKACQIDTADCEDTITHCHSVAAYRTLLKESGVRAKKIDDCYPKNAGKSWTLKQKKEVDIVVLMSARKEARDHKKIIASMLYNMNKKITSMGFETRYSLISYGSAIKGIYGARSHTFNGKYFSNENVIATEIKAMDYTGKKTDVNDYNQAIMSATKMPFKPEASRVIVLFNFDKYIPSWYGPTSDETKFALKYKANASLFVFDKFNFDDFQTGIFKAIGLTKDKMYMTPSLKTFPMTKMLPKTPFTKYVYRNGGLFTNEMTKKTEKVYTGALSNAVMNFLEKEANLCKKCSWSKYGVICKTDNTAKC